jgi:hypothetical protein
MVVFAVDISRRMLAVSLRAHSQVALFFIGRQDTRSIGLRPRQSCTQYH